jgi:hypothetical protein
MVQGEDASYLYLSDLSRLIPNRSRLTAGEETRKTFDLVEQVLERARWSFPDVCRTWFYLHHILDWYGEFNQIRNQTFDHHGLFSKSCPRPIPASTGVYGRNLGGNWCTLDLLAIRARQGSKLEIQRLSNPQQNEAPEYGSAFSRGLCVTTESCRYVTSARPPRLSSAPVMSQATRRSSIVVVWETCRLSVPLVMSAALSCCSSSTQQQSYRRSNPKPRPHSRQRVL